MVAGRNAAETCSNLPYLPFWSHLPLVRLVRLVHQVAWHTNSECIAGVSDCHCQHMVTLSPPSDLAVGISHVSRRILAAFSPVSIKRVAQTCQHIVTLYAAEPRMRYLRRAVDSSKLAVGSDL